MKEKFINLIGSIFSIFILLGLLGGGIIFLMFLLALIIGGDKAAILSTMASETIMPYFIKSATVGIMAGLIVLYFSGDHHLSLK